MSLIFKNGKMYGGNDVAANPTLTPSTRDLGSISIDGITYNVGGNTGTAYKETVLWEGSESTSRWVEPIVLQNIDIGAYDQIIVQISNGQHIISANQIPFGNASGNNCIAVSGYLDNSGDNWRPIYLNKDIGNIFRVFCTTGKGITLTKVVGIKTGVGGGATSADWELLASVTGSEVVDISNYYVRADEFNIVLKVDGYDNQVLTTTFPKSAIPESNGRISLGRNYCDALVKVSPASIQLYQCRGNSSEDVLSTTTMDVYYRKSGAQICFGFIDTTNVIVPQTNINSQTTYTATQDCYLKASLAAANGTNAQVLLDGVEVSAFYSNGTNQPCWTVPMRKGQTATIIPTYSAGSSGYAVYGIARGSEVPAYDLVRGNVYGAFIDTDRIIKSKTTVSSQTTYTATEDCAICVTYSATSSAASYIRINGIVAFSSGGSSLTSRGILYLQKGDTMTFVPAGAYNDYTIYGLSYGTQNIFAPQIYSLTEREVGTWIDNKPLYCKTIEIPSFPSSTAAMNKPHNISNIDTIAHYEAHVRWASGAMVVIPNAQVNNGSFVAGASFDCTVNKTDITIRTGMNRSSLSGDITIWYTKTTDTMGSGSYNTLGVPTIHYTADEQVVGTYLGKPLYQRVITPIVTANTTLAGDIKYGSVALGDYINSVDMAFVDLSASYIEPATGATRGLISAYYEKDSGNIVIVTMFARTNSLSSLCIKYTKITD